MHASLAPQLRRTLEPQLRRTLEPQLRRTLEPQLRRTLEPQLRRTLEPQLRRTLAIQLRRRQRTRGGWPRCLGSNSLGGNSPGLNYPRISYVAPKNQLHILCVGLVLLGVALPGEFFHEQRALVWAQQTIEPPPVPPAKNPPAKNPPAKNNEPAQLPPKHAANKEKPAPSKAPERTKNAAAQPLAEGGEQKTVPQAVEQAQELPAPAPPQNLSQRFGDLRQIAALRDAQQTEEAEPLSALAQAYLQDQPQGRYRDEALLILGQALSMTQRKGEALEALERLIVDHPESPFRAQAVVAQLPLLEERGEADRGVAQVQRLIQDAPRSVHLPRARVWLAQQQLASGDPTAAQANLNHVDGEAELPAEVRRDWLRLLVRTAVYLGNDAELPLANYLRGSTAPAEKAALFTEIAEHAHSQGQPALAMRWYRRVVEEYPQAPQQGQAQFGLARATETLKVDRSTTERRRAGILESLGLYQAYLDGGDSTYRAEAFLARARLQHYSAAHVKAREDLQQALRLAPQLGEEIYVLRLELSLESALGNPAQAEARLQEMLHDPLRSPVLRAKLRLEFAARESKQKRCTEAERALTPMPALLSKVQRAQALQIRGLCRHARKAWAQAASDLEQSFSVAPLVPQNPQPTGLVADDAASAERLRIATETLPESYRLALQHARLAAWLQRGLQEGWLKADAQTYLALGEAYFHSGEWEPMGAAYAQLLEQHPAAGNDVRVLFRLGQLAEWQNRTEEAQAHYLAVLQLPAPALPATQTALPATQAALPATQAALPATQAAPVDQAPPPAETATATTRTPSVQVQALGRILDYRLRENDFSGAQSALEQSTAWAHSEADQAGVQRLRQQLYIAWATHPQAEEQSAAHWGEALRNTPYDPPQQRARLLHRAITDLQRKEAKTGAVNLFLSEHRDAPDPYRQEIRNALPPALQSWLGQASDPQHVKQSIAYHQQRLDQLPADAHEKRWDVLQDLDRLYQLEDNSAARVQLAAKARNSKAPPALAQKLRRHHALVLLDSARSLAREGKHGAAQRNFRASLAQTHSGEDPALRYEIVSTQSEFLSTREQYGAAALAYDPLLSELKEDSPLRIQANRRLGRIYLLWAAQEQAQPKSVRIRSQSALDHLPQAQWQERLAAAARMVNASEREGSLDAEIVKTYALVLQATPAEQARPYALHLGRVYLEKLKDAQQARVWLTRADDESNDKFALQAGFLLAEMEISSKRPAAALQRLEALLKRGLAQSGWSIPVHYRLALLHHQKERWAQALTHYEAVTAVQTKAERRRYQRSLQDAQQQVQRIRRYQKQRPSKGVNIPRVSGS